MDILLDTLHTYYLYALFDPFFSVSLFGLFVQVLTLIIAGCALIQLGLMKQQNRYAMDLNKIDALNRFKEILNEGNRFVTLFNKKQGHDLPKIELTDYIAKELTKREDNDNFQEWIKALSDQELRQAAVDLANNLELFAMSLEDEDIFSSIRDMVAQAFCELVEMNPAIYITHRNEGGKSVHKRYQGTIKFRNRFMPLVGSIKQREEITRINVEKYKDLYKK